jgi:hypothetical protein
MEMVRSIAPYDLLFVTQPPKLVLRLPKEPDSLVSMELKPVLLALPAHLASEEGETAKASKK